MFGLAQKPCLTFPQFDLAGGDRASGDFVFEPPDQVIELSILAAAWNKEKRESTYSRGSAFRPRCDHGCLSPCVAGEVLVARQAPMAFYQPANSGNIRAKIRSTLDLRHPRGPLPYGVVFL